MSTTATDIGRAATYPVRVVVDPSSAERDRLTVGFRMILAIPRIILAIPHLIVVWVLTLGWVLTTVFAWFAILLTGRYPDALFRFGVGVLRWNARVEAYLLLLTDQYPPFSLD